MTTDKVNHASQKSDKPARESANLSPSEAQHVGSLSAEETQAIRERQDARSRVLGLILLGLCVLFFAITIVKIGLT